MISTPWNSVRQVTITQQKPGVRQAKLSEIRHWSERVSKERIKAVLPILFVLYFLWISKDAPSTKIKKIGSSDNEHRFQTRHLSVHRRVWESELNIMHGETSLSPVVIVECNKVWQLMISRPASEIIPQSPQDQFWIILEVPTILDVVTIWMHEIR